MTAVTGPGNSLEYIFHPRSIAFVGVSRLGQALLESHLTAGFPGKVFPVSRTLSEVLGLPCYRELNDIPEPVDQVIASIPAQASPQLIRDCIAKRVQLVSFFTAGFSEKDAEGTRLEAEIAQLARNGRLRILGPNCMGLYSPLTGLALGLGLPRQSGPVGLFGQSGGNVTYAIRAAVARGAYFTKAVSYGNACDLNECHFLEYFAADPETRIIAIYIEGPKESKRFFKLLKQVTTSKPVVVLRGGHTPAGAATAAAHTGSRFPDNDEWNASIADAGAIQVYSVDEMVDVLIAFLFMRPPRGRNTTIIGLGGGASVVAADHAFNAGLALPPLPEELRSKLATFVHNPAGNIFSNPVDPQASPEGTASILNAVAGWDGVDILFLRLPHNITPYYQDPGQSLDVLIGFARDCNKAAAVILEHIATPEAAQFFFDRQKACASAGVASFPSVERAAIAVNRIIAYLQKNCAGRRSVGRG